MKKIFFLLLSMLPIANLSAQNVFEKDPTWNTYELPSDHFYVDGYHFIKSEIQSDAKVIVALTNYSSVPTSSLVRLENNQRDTTFLSGTFNGTIKDFLIQPDGKIVVVGTFTMYEGVAAKYMVRLNPDGTRDTGFDMGTGFTVEMFSTYTWAEVVKIQSDGKLLVGGDDITSYNGFAANAIVRINTDGSPDTTFTFDPTAYNLGVHSITVQPNGKILIGSGGRLYRAETNGTLDPTWALNTPQAAEPTFSSNYSYRQIKTIVVLADGKILIGGEFEEAFGSGNRRDIIRLNADGSPDGTFYSQGFRTVTNYRQGVNSIVVLPDGKLIIGGDFTRWHIDSGTVLMTPKCILRLNANGSLDSSFAGIASFSNDYDDSNWISDMKMTPDGKLLLTGRINSYNGVAVNNIVKIDADGNRDTSFHNICKGFNGTTKQILQQPDGKIIVSGAFSMYNGFTRDRLIRLNIDGSIDQGFNAKCYEFVADYTQIWDLALQSDGKLLVASSGRYYNATPGGSLVRLNADGSLDTSFVSLTPGNYGLSGYYSCVKLQSDGKILTVGRTFSDNVIKRFNADGTPDTTFNFTTYTNCSKIAIQPDGRILFSYSTTSGINTYKMGRLLADGQIDTSFTAPASSPGVTNFSLQPDGKVLCFSDVIGGHNVFRLNSDGSSDTGFSFPSSQTFQSENTANALLPDGKILMGVRMFTGFPNYLVRRNVDGSSDSTFDIGTGFSYGIGYSPSITEVISDVDVDPYGRILVSGAFRSFDGQPENAFVRLRPEGLLSTPDFQRSSFTVYPNPAGDVIHISVRNDKTIDSIGVYSVLGAKITSVKLSATLRDIDVSSLQAGLYFVKITSDEKVENVRFIKK